MRASENQVSGSHYKNYAIQPAEFIQKNGLNWCEGNVIKYIVRHRDKKGAEDLLKAKHYIDLLLEWEYDRFPAEPLNQPKTSGIVKDTTAASLCHTCQRNKMCVGEYPMTKDGGCEGYIPNLRERMLDAKQDTPTAAERPAPHTDPAVSALDFSLPPITLKCTAEEAAGKFWSEREEWKAAKKGSIHELVERWDCLQALYTFAERGGDVEWYQDHVRVVMEDLARYQADGGEVMRAKRQMLRKNAKRSYYAPEVNEAILSTCGHRYTPVLGG